jgi:chemotaxis protein histidine kinase CheA/ActR/RegA family two-component response regulator
MSGDEPQVVAPGSPLSGDRLEALAEHWQEVLAAPSQPSSAAVLRRELLDLRAEIGLDSLARVVDRLAALTEVWECLLADAPESADEVGIFCARSLAEIGRAERSGGSETIQELVLEQSSASWGEYLALLEPSGPELAANDEFAEAEPEAMPDDTPAIDAQALLRLFRGPATDGPAEAEPELPPPAPAPSPPRHNDRLKIPALPARLDLDDEIRDAFLADATELFERVEPLVLGLPRSSDLAADLSELRRALHTLKGAAGSVGLVDLAAVVHHLEERIEEAGATVPSALGDALLAMLGYLEGLLGLLRRGPRPATAGAKTASTAAPALRPEPEPPLSAAPEPGGGDVGPVRVASARFDDLLDIASELIVRRRVWTAHAEALKSITAMVRSCRGQMLGVLDRLHEAGLGREEAGRRLDPHADLPGQLRRLGEVADDLAVLAESSREAALSLADHGDAMGRLATQLWDEFQAIRIVPVRGLFQRLARVAHEAARVEGRRVEVGMLGEETGVDRAVQDKAFEPLLHVVRNAVGHGIEAPEERARAGKPSSGRITLEARREGNSLVLSVADDGRGLDLPAIEAKARRVGLLSPGERPSAERLRNLIFHPGFSTRSQANAISGRGVGMDVVAREVGLLKGTVELASESGKGTRQTIRLPVRLALETAMVVQVDGQGFAVPVAQIEHAQVAGDGQQVEIGRVLPFRDGEIPVLRAREILYLNVTPAAAWPKLLVVRHGGGLVGLVVDAIEGTEDLVIKPLGSLLAGHPLISGTSLSIRGEVISVLDPSRLGRWVGAGGLPAATAGSTAGRETRPRGVPAVLVVDDSISVRKVLARGLQAMRLEVDEVSDGLEALGRLRGRSYDLVVTDLEMPRLDGFELVAEMQRVAALARIPVVVASTRADEETRRRVLGLGARQFLAKPVEPKALAEAVAPLLGRATERAGAAWAEEAS